MNDQLTSHDCSQCGRPVDDDSTFCSACGHPHLADRQLRAIASEIGLDVDQGIGVQDALKLADHINRSHIHYGSTGLNARQVSRLQERPEGEAWSKIVREYNKWYRGSASMQWVWLATGMAGLILLTWREVQFTGSLAVGAAMFGYACARLDRLSSHWNGYFDGYESGRSDGVLAALDITDSAEIQEMNERAIQMEIDEHVTPPGKVASP